MDAALPTVPTPPPRRSPRIGLTGTLLPVLTPRVLTRLRLSNDVRIVRGAIDRCDVGYYRLPLEWVEGEGVVAMGRRALTTSRAAAPAWATQVRTMVFVTLTTTALGLITLEMALMRPDGEERRGAQPTRARSRGTQGSLPRDLGN